MNSGSYTWHITNPQLVNAICNANLNTKFTSDIFTIGKLKWQIILYPNGFNETSKGSFLICIKLISMPQQWKGFISSRTSECIETSTSDTTIRHYSKSGQVKGCSLYSLSLSELKSINPSKITIFTSINILKITLKNNKILHEAQIGNFKTKSTFKWTLHQSMFKQCKFVKALQSPIHNEIWRMRCYPGGEEFKGYVSIFLILSNLPPHLSKVKISYKLKCVEANITSSATDTLFLNDRMHYSAGFKRFVSHEKVEHLQKLTFEAEIVILKGYDNKGNEVQIIDEFQQIQNEIIYIKQQMHKTGYKMVDARLDSLSTNIKQIKNNFDYMKQSLNNKQFICNHKYNTKEEEMKQWMMDVVGLPQYINIFIENGFEDMDTIKYITMNELKMIGIEKIGHKIKIITAIQQFNKCVKHVYEQQTQAEGGNVYVY